MKSNSEARPSAVVLFYYTSISTILQPLGSGYQEIKVDELQRTEDHGKVIFASVFYFAVIHPTCKHALRRVDD